MQIVRDLIGAWREKAQTYKTMQDVLSGAVSRWDLIARQGHIPAMQPAKAVEQYKSWCYACANRNAAALAKASLRLYSTRNTGEGQVTRRKAAPVMRDNRARLKRRLSMLPRVKAADEIEEIMEHPALTLLQQINSQFNQFDSMELSSLYLDLSGSAYWHIIRGPLGVPGELWILPSQYVKAIPDEKRFISGFLYGRTQSQQRTLKPQDVIWFRRPNPKDMWSGMGRIEGAWAAVCGYESIDKFDFNATETQGIKQFLINYKNISLNRKARRDAMAAWTQALEMASRTHAPLIGDQDIEIKDAAWSPRELAFLQGRKWHKEEIIIAFGQHPAMYVENANTANIQGAIYLWEEYEITPTLKRIEQKLNEQLLPMYGGNGADRLFLAFDDVVVEDKTQLRADAELMLRYGYPLNRVLTDTFKLEPVAGGDTGYIPFNLVPLGTPAAMPGQQGTQDQNNDASAINARSATTARRYTGKTGGTIIFESGANRIEVKADRTVADISLTGGANPALSATEQQIAAAMRQAWAAQLTLALSEVPKQATATFSHLYGEDLARQIAELTEGAIKVEVELGGIAGGRKIGVELIDFIDRPHVRAAIRAHSYKFARAVNARSADELRRAMAQGIALGESIPELSDRISELHEGWNGFRAERIARTESARANNMGMEEQWRESGVVSAKEWLASGDACPFCLAMNGKRIGLGTEYIGRGGTQSVEFNGGPISLAHDYMDVMGPPLHPNCRCTMLAVLIER